MTGHILGTGQAMLGNRWQHCLYIFWNDMFSAGDKGIGLRALHQGHSRPGGKPEVETIRLPGEGQNPLHVIKQSVGYKNPGHALLQLIKPFPINGRRQLFHILTGIEAVEQFSLY